MNSPKEGLYIDLLSAIIFCTVLFFCIRKVYLWYQVRMQDRKFLGISWQDSVSETRETLKLRSLKPR